MNTTCEFGFKCDTCEIFVECTHPEKREDALHVKAEPKGKPEGCPNPGKCEVCEDFSECALVQ